MIITGKLIGYGRAKAAYGNGVHYQIVLPDKTLDNLKAIALEGQRWLVTAERLRNLANEGHLDVAIARRATFTEEVLASIGEYLRIGAFFNALAVDDYGRIIGASSYGIMFPGEAALNLQAIDPANLAGAPGSQQLRGIGTAMVAAISRQLLHDNIESVILHPFDQQAAIFWYKRGFVPAGKGGLMRLSGRKGIEKLIDGCIAVPDEPGKGDIVICGEERTTAPVRLPQAASVH